MTAYLNVRMRGRGLKTIAPFETGNSIPNTDIKHDDACRITFVRQVLFV